MKLTVITPCYNERRFVTAWLANCCEFADEVIISEGGSTDGTRDMLADWQAKHHKFLTILDTPQSSQPNRDGFREGTRRQLLTSMVKEGLIIFLDVDEMLSDNFRAVVEKELPANHVGLVTCYNFWRSPGYIRVAAPEDGHWGPVRKTVACPAGTVQWNEHSHDARMTYSLPTVKLSAVKFHYHYLYDERKSYENRLLEYLGRADPEIRLRRVELVHPRALALLADEHAHWADMARRPLTEGGA